MDLAIIALTFGTVFLIELPDKTMLATLVLSTRFRPLLVWIGVSLAFAVHMAIAVSLGKVVGFLPDEAVKGGTAALFLVGAFLLLREARTADEDEDETEAEYAAKADARGPRGTAWATVVTCFLVLFTAEWGDLSQLLVLSLAAKYDAPFSVFSGATAALVCVAGLAVLLGRWLLARIRLSTLHYVGAGICLVLAAVTLYELF